MTKVWVVLWNSDEGQHFEGVFSTRQKAEEYITRCWSKHDEVYAEEWQLDVGEWDD